MDNKTEDKDKEKIYEYFSLGHTLLSKSVKKTGELKFPLKSPGISVRVHGIAYSTTSPARSVRSAWNSEWRNDVQNDQEHAVDDASFPDLSKSFNTSETSRKHAKPKEIQPVPDQLHSAPPPPPPNPTNKLNKLSRGLDAVSSNFIMPGMLGTLPVGFVNFIGRGNAIPPPNSPTGPRPFQNDSNRQTPLEQIAEMSIQPEPNRKIKPLAPEQNGIIVATNGVTQTVAITCSFEANKQPGDEFFQQPIERMPQPPEHATRAVFVPPPPPSPILLPTVPSSPGLYAKSKPFGHYKNGIRRNGQFSKSQGAFKPLETSQTLDPQIIAKGANQRPLAARKGHKQPPPPPPEDKESWRAPAVGKKAPKKPSTDKETGISGTNGPGINPETPIGASETASSPEKAPSPEKIPNPERGLEKGSSGKRRFNYKKSHGNSK
ncbi:hypothetical protein BdWA1_000622 [Babesia duncani]|uniref:Uncharacterized protein n=1 Tax=Babesia duncani TaxID=323732 RepID=A0AAD9UQ93_9APIC|nr:hypothetical protein BdWA1_000622 [Babesia duncani]